MLSSIHPFGERSRNNQFAGTAIAHVFASTLGGLILGVLAGGVGALLTFVLAIPSTARTAIVFVAAGIATILEATKRERILPTRARQVNENWIQTYRGWIYGAGFGAELGFGISTIITTTLVHLLVVTMVLLGDPVTTAFLGALFGLVRGATLLAGARVDSPERLRAFHQRLDQFRDRSRAGAVASLGAATAVGLWAVAGLGSLL